MFPLTPYIPSAPLEENNFKYTPNTPGGDTTCDKTKELLGKIDTLIGTKTEELKAFEKEKTAGREALTFVIICLIILSLIFPLPAIAVGGITATTILVIVMVELLSIFFTYLSITTINKIGKNEEMYTSFIKLLNQLKEWLEDSSLRQEELSIKFSQALLNFVTNLPSDTKKHPLLNSGCPGELLELQVKIMKIRKDQNEVT
jgi:hypothetical protein